MRNGFLIPKQMKRPKSTYGCDLLFREPIKAPAVIRGLCEFFCKVLEGWCATLLLLNGAAPDYILTLKFSHERSLCDLYFPRPR